jgi:putative hemolysin
MPLIDTARFLPGPAFRTCYRPIQPVVERAFGFHGLERRYRSLPDRGRSAAEFARIALRELGISWEMSPADKAALAAIDGPIVLCANHPCGPIEPLALMDLLDEIRPGNCCVLANRILGTIPELKESLIPVEPLHRGEPRQNGANGFAGALKYLRQGGALLTFPAGRVSGRTRELHAVCDRPWSDHPPRLARMAGASVVCLHVEGRASRLFLRVPNHWSSLRALLLPREMNHPHSRHLKLRLAGVWDPAETQALVRGPHPSQRLRAHCYLVADRALADPAPPPPVSGENTRDRPPANAGKLKKEIARLRDDGREMFDRGTYSVLLFRGDESRTLLEEIGRQREITFQAAGQGTGREIDLSNEDDYYHHLILWDREEDFLAGAYRLGFEEEIRAERGAEALYLQPLFRFHKTFYRRIGPGAELSRSFVVPARQRDGRALACLWKGLSAAAVQRNCRTYYGCVTISNLFHPASRAILVDFLDRHYSDDAGLRRLAHPVHPFQPETRYHRLLTEAFACEKIDALRPVIEEIENGHRSIPPLIRYYCSLGARYLAFHVEPSFGNAVYCLLRVDLNELEKRYQRRF